MESGPFAPSGFTGATAASRYVGATASGAPVTGTFLLGDFVVDQTGIIWVCTTAGTPGTWTPIQPNVELGTAQITSNFTTASGGWVDVVGLSSTVTVGSRPILVWFTCRLLKASAAANVALQLLEDGSTVVGDCIANIGSANGGTAATILARRAPSAGAHTYKIQGASDGTNTLTLGASATSPAKLEVIQI